MSGKRIVIGGCEWDEKTYREFQESAKRVAAAQKETAREVSVNEVIRSLKMINETLQTRFGAMERQIADLTAAVNKLQES